MQSWLACRQEQLWALIVVLVEASTPGTALHAQHVADHLLPPIHLQIHVLQDALTATEQKLDIAKKRLYFPAAKGYG